MQTIELTDFKQDPERALKLASVEELVITEDGNPKFSVSCIVNEDDAGGDEWEKELFNNPHFIAEIECGKQDIAQGRGIRFEDIDWS